MVYLLPRADLAPQEVLEIDVAGARGPPKDGLGGNRWWLVVLLFILGTLYYTSASLDLPYVH